MLQTEANILVDNININVVNMHVFCKIGYITCLIVRHKPAGNQLTLVLGHFIKYRLYCIILFCICELQVPIKDEYCRYNPHQNLCGIPTITG